MISLQQPRTDARRSDGHYGSIRNDQRRVVLLRRPRIAVHPADETRPELAGSVYLVEEHR